MGGGRPADEGPLVQGQGDQPETAHGGKGIHRGLVDGADHIGGPLADGLPEGLGHLVWRAAAHRHQLGLRLGVVDAGSRPHPIAHGVGHPEQGSFQRQQKGHLIGGRVAAPHDVLPLPPEGQVGAALQAEDQGKDGDRQDRGGAPKNRAVLVHH
jgi:hypothetical protein